MVPKELVGPADKAPDALRIGMLGASFIGQVALVFPAGKLRDVKVAAVAARDLARAQAYAKRHGIPAAYGGGDAYQDLLASEDIDAVYISLPTHLHHRWAMAALTAGKHVLVEKPITTKLAEAQELLELAKKKNLLLMEAAHYRYHPAGQRMKQLMSVKKDAEGFDMQARFDFVDPKSWLASTLGLQPPPDASEERQHERLKNLDRWWYCVDSMMWVLDATAAQVVSASEGRFSLYSELELTFEAPGNQTHGARAALTMSRDRLLPKPFDWSIGAFGRGWRLHFSNLGFPFLWHSIEVSGGEQRLEQHYGDGGTTFQYQLEAFVRFVHDLRTGSPLDREDLAGLKTQKVVDAIVAAAGRGHLQMS